MWYNITMEKIKYKYRQEKILIDELSSTPFVCKEVLYEIKSFYNKNVPYHNFLHVLQVSREILRLSSDDFNILEIKSLLFAGLFHDAWHTGQSEILDEFNSLDIALEKLTDLQNRFDIWILDDRIIRKAIVWTVFSNRWKLTDKFAKILWDFDIGVIWWKLLEFCYYGLPFWYELGQSEEVYITKTEIGYFKYIMSFDKKIILTSEVQEILPNSIKNIKQFMQMDLSKKIEMMKVIKNEDITYDEFEKRFK